MCTECRAFMLSSSQSIFSCHGRVGVCENDVRVTHTVDGVAVTYFVKENKYICLIILKQKKKNVDLKSTQESLN